MTTNASQPRVPWEKARGESAPAFAAFALYRDLGPQRSTSKVAQELSKARSLITGWSSKNDWVSRADQYDRYVDERHREADLEDWRLANQRHRVIAGTITSSLMRRLQGDTRPGREVQAINPADMDWGDIRGLARDAVAIERLVHGQPTDFALRATTMSTVEALRHVQLLIELARRRMAPEDFTAFIVDYAAKTAANLGEEPELSEPKELTA